MPFLFCSGTARGGTNYRTLILNNHSDIKLQLDPFIPLFRFYRDSLLKCSGFDPSGLSPVLDDYYFSSVKHNIFQILQNSNPDIPFDSSVWPVLRESMIKRMSLASMNLISNIDLLPAPTFKEVFLNTANLIFSSSFDGLETQWVGFNDNWTLEFFPLLAQLFPDSKFIINLRDPRSVVFSSEVAEPEPAKRPTVITFARHLRKYFALSTAYQSNPILKNRLLITQYEPFIESPDSSISSVLNFLNLKPEPLMTDITRFTKADGSPWPSTPSHYSNSHVIWRKEMPKEMAELTEFICDPEMRLFGYTPEVYDPSTGLSQGAFQYALDNINTCTGWNTDFVDPEQSLACEFFRKQALSSSVDLTESQIKRCFLFDDVYKACLGIL